jgi:type IV pilus assembly protein PilQ
MLIAFLCLALAGTPTISLEFQDADIHTVLRFLADAADLNLVVSDQVQGRVTLRLKDVAWQDALAAVLASKGLAATTLDGTLIVAMK